MQQPEMDGMEMQVMICDFSDYRLAIVKELGFEICNDSKESLTEKAKAYFGTGYGYKGETYYPRIFISTD